MKDLKEFLKKKAYCEIGMRTNSLKDKSIGIYDLGIFSWERGGKEFAKKAVEYRNDGEDEDFSAIYVTDFIEEDATAIIELYDAAEDGGADYQSYKDTLDCLGKTKVLEMIQEIIDKVKA